MLAVLATATYAAVHGSYQLDLAVRVLLAAFVAMGLRLLVGLAGQSARDGRTKPKPPESIREDGSGESV